MEANAHNYYPLLSTDEKFTAKIEDFNIRNSTEEKLLGLKFDSDLVFENLVTFFVKRQARNYIFLQGKLCRLTQAQKPYGRFH